MRLLFLCSGLEPGRDGVGDYTRCLAQAAAKAGHAVGLAAVRDDFATLATELPSAPGAGQVRELRLPDVFVHPDQAAKLVAFIERCAPDWVSVQHSAFGWHPRGLGENRAAQVRQWLPAATRRHLMLHELWLERHRGQSWRRWLLGWLQRGVIKSWLGGGLQPHLAHVQCRWYESQLAELGFAAPVWPLCSNFPVPAPLPAPDTVWLRQQAGVLTPGGAPPPYWLGHFGSFYIEEWQPRMFLEKFARTVSAAGRQLVVVALGNMRMGREAWQDLEKRPPPGVIVASTASLSPTEISRAMMSCDGAFCTTPWPMVEKSSAAAVWRAHGVPVLTPRTKTDTARAARLPAWPDAGLIPAHGTTIPLPPARVPPPEFLDPKTSMQKLVELFELHDSRDPQEMRP